MLIWLMRRLHCDLKETLIDARLLARAFTLEQYDAMSELERRQTCEELWARAVADSALRRAGGEAAVQLSKLKELRALTSPSAAKLEMCFMLEAGEAPNRQWPRPRRRQKKQPTRRRRRRRFVNRSGR